LSRKAAEQEAAMTEHGPPFEAGKMRRFDEIDRFFNPRTVALVGVSRHFGFGHGLPGFFARIGLADRVFPVNPKIDEIQGLKVYPSVRAIPCEIDLACVLVPAPSVSEVLNDCIAAGVKAVIVMSAGFAETGAEGRRRQEALAAMARRAGVRLMGPNCIGVVNVPARFATCEIFIEDMKPGTISIVAQSGVFGNILMDAAPSMGIAVSKVATIGNRADLDETDLVEYLAEDPATAVIVLYLESIRRGRAFLEAVRRASRRKPVLAFLGGQTEAGRRATQSHTGSMAGFGKLEKALLRQAGLWIARDPVELLETARAFALSPPMRGPRVFVVTASGSLGVMAADRLVEEGLELAEPSGPGFQRLRDKAPPWMNMGNPLDVGPSGLFAEGAAAALEHPDADAVILIPVIPWAVVSPLLEADRLSVAAMFGPRRGEAGGAAPAKPIIVCPQGHPGWKQACLEFYGPETPFAATPQAAATALAALYRYWRRRS